MKGLSPVLITDATEIDLFECLKYDQIRNNGILHMYLPHPYTGYIDVQLCGTRVRYGRRIWFQAPCCHRKTSKLYIYANRIACRKCHDLKYPSQYQKDSFSRSMMTQRKLQRLQKRRLWNGDSLTRFGVQYRKLQDESYRQTQEMLVDTLESSLKMKEKLSTTLDEPV